MTSEEAEVFKVMAELGLHNPVLQPDQEEMLKRALDPDSFFLDDVERLFTDQTPK